MASDDSMSRRMTEQDRIHRAAAEWVVRWQDREREPAPREQSRWFAWLRRSPLHLQAYFDLSDIHERLGRMDPDGKIDVDEWLAGRQTPVVPITPAVSARPPRQGASRFRAAWMSGVLAASLVAAVAGVFAWGLLERTSYRTVVGQQSVSRLDDGSIVNLNTQSRVKVTFSEKRRLVDLDGEALFTVAKDPARPFLVRTRTATIRALGTQFNVYEQDGQTRVAVLEGAVQVAPVAQSQTEAVALAAGESARVSAGHVEKELVRDVEAQIAWQHQKLVFEDARLEEVAAEFNRYNKSQLRIEGALGRTRRLSGTFDALHPQSLLLYLQKDAALSVQPLGDDFIIREHQPSDDPADVR
jgi:transmembrane sensor